MENNDYLKYLSKEDQEAIKRIRLECQEKERKQREETLKALENKTFAGRVKNGWIDTRKEEKENSFSIRHSNLEKAANNYYDKDEKFLSLKKGIVHVFGETLYHLDKLRIKKHDNVERYTIRNRGLALILAVSMILVGAHACKNNEKEETTQLTAIEQLDGIVTLSRYYTVKPNDTLYVISLNSGISIDKIVRDNDISNANIIQPNQRLQLNYSVDKDDLEYYTEVIDVNNQSIYSIAAEYETDAETIVRLNPESVNYNMDNGTYQIISDTILVPNFITARELTELTNNNQK